MSVTKCLVNYSCLTPLTSHPSGLPWPQTGQCGCPGHPWCSDATNRVCVATPASSWHHFLPSLCVMGSELSDRDLPVFKSVKYYVRGAVSIKETSTYLIRTQATWKRPMCSCKGNTVMKQFLSFLRTQWTLHLGEPQMFALKAVLVMKFRASKWPLRVLLFILPIFKEADCQMNV